MRQYIFQVLLSIGLSALVLGLLIQGSLSSATPALWPQLVNTLLAVSPFYIGLYFGAAMLRTVFRALRYQVLLSVSEPDCPGFFHIFLVTMCRNMFVDMLPARLGELSYIAMLNRGYRVGVESCISSLAVSFVFDLIALGLIVLGIIVYQIFSVGLQGWVVGTFIFLVFIVIVLSVLLFPGLEFTAERMSRSTFLNRGMMKKLILLMQKTVIALRKTRQAGIFTRVLALSIAVRAGKYLALYALFFGVVSAGFFEVDRHPVPALIALISAEAGAGLPLPAFMGFGTYETGGTLALMALGANRTVSVVSMLCVHIWSQVVDYGLGGTALVLFVFLSTYGLKMKERVSLSGLVRYGVAGAVVLAGVVFLFSQFLNLKKMGSLFPPDKGEAVTSEGSKLKDRQISLARLSGFIVWSSNRFGNHDLVMLSLPEQKLTRITSDPHAEYFPRVSPDGTKVVFCRSQETWVPQRNYFAWDVYLLDLSTGKERLLAKNANVPTWSVDGSKMYFQHMGNQFIEYTLASGKEVMLFATGNNLPLDASVMLETPAWSERRQSLAVTLRKGKRGTVIINKEKKVRQVGNGCELNWAPDSSYLYYVDHGGKGQNAFYKVDPESLQKQMWFDSPSEYSHEYFPKISNTGEVLVFGASRKGHEHDKADYEIFLWKIGSPAAETVRVSYHTGNDNWPDIYLNRPLQ